MLNRLATFAVLLVVLALAGAAFAGNGAGSNKSSSSSSISAPIVVSATAGAASVGARYGDAITFAVSTTATDQPFVNLVCNQNGALVLNGSGAFWSGSPTFNLTSGAWGGGGADCTATLFMYVSSDKTKTLASSSFHVSA